MILTDLFESQEIHDQDRLDQVLARCIEMVHEKNRANPKKYGKVAACIIDMQNRKVFGINLPGADGRRRHAERVAIDAYHKRYGKILPGAIIVTTLSPCNRDMEERDGPSCQDLLLQAGIEKVYSGYMDPSQHSDHPFTEETTQNDDLWRSCKELSDSFVHDDLTESEHHGMDADQVLDYVKRAHAPEAFDIEYSITDHPKWELKTIPLSQLNLDPDGEAQDPYNRVNWVDYDKVQELIPRIGSVLKRMPIVVDPAGWIIDGNHRAMAAVEAGLTSVPALIPIKQTVGEDHADQKQLDPELYEELPAGFLRGIVTRALPGVPLRFRTTPEGYLSVRATDGSVKLDIGMGIAGGDIGFNIENAYLTQHQGAGVMTQIITDAYQTVERKYGRPQSRSLNVMQDRGHGVWQAIAHKLGAEYHSVSQMGESAEQDVEENFADGRVKGKSRPGRVKRSGASCDGSVTDLRAKAKKYGGERGKMYHWCANMKGGKK